MLPNILQKKASDFLEAGKKILEDRGKTYDKDNKQEKRSMEKVVKVFEVITGKVLTETEGWEFMACLKQVRAFQKEAFHEDSWQDAVNYLALGAEAKAREVPEIQETLDYNPATGHITIYREGRTQVLLPKQSEAWCAYEASQHKKGFKAVSWNELDSHEQDLWLGK